MSVLNYEGLTHLVGLIKEKFSPITVRDDLAALKEFFEITDDSTITLKGTAQYSQYVNTQNDDNVSLQSGSSAIGHLTFTSISDSGTYQLKKISTLKINYAPGTTTSTGYACLNLGNATKTGSAGNAYGYIKLYGTSSGAITLRPISSLGTTSYTISLPAKTGTLALTSDLSSYLLKTDFNAHVGGAFKDLSDTVASHTTSIGTTIPSTYATKTELTNLNTSLTTRIDGLLDGVTEDQLNTFKELSAALDDDKNFAANVDKAISDRVLTTTYTTKIDSIDSEIAGLKTGKAPTSHASTTTSYGASTASAYGHAMASSTSPKANGTAAVGSETAKFARGDHVHPLQTTVSGNAGSANKVNSNLVIKLNSGSTEGTNLFTFNGSAAKTINITAASINAMAIDCTIDCGNWS